MGSGGGWECGCHACHANTACACASLSPQSYAVRSPQSHPALSRVHPALSRSTYPHNTAIRSMLS